jgi:hypothetical protein
MESTRIDLHSRISIRAIGAGVVVTYSTMLLLEALAGGFNLWRFDISELPRLSGGFWLFATVAWVVSSFLGAYVSSMVGRSVHSRDGLLHGVITWASAAILAYALTVLSLGNLWAENFGDTAPAYLFAIFFGDLFALGAALLGGRQGAAAEAKMVRR